MKQRFLVDTDMGVDDAAAIAWLLHQTARPVELCGVCSVWGNNSAERAAQNALAVLAALGHAEVPVAVGAAGPLSGRPSKVGVLAHGRDGLWGVSPPVPAASSLKGNAIDLYRSTAEQFPGATLLAIGPLTNLARVLDESPDTLRAFEQIIVLGGARHHGTMTPVSETNFWHDPEAADRVLGARLPITLVTRDAHREFLLRPADIELLKNGISAPARQLFPAIDAYARAARRFGETVNLGDVVAAAVAVDRSFASEVVKAFVRVIGSTEPLVRGQSVMATTPNEKLTLADGGMAAMELIERVAEDDSLDVRALLGSILARTPDNAEVVLEIDAERMRNAFLEVFS